MIYDITQPLFSCEVYPGDDCPERRLVYSIENGDLYNLTSIFMCVHNGTHVDAPRHFLREGKGIDGIALEKFIGPAFVHTYNGELTAFDAAQVLSLAKQTYDGAQKKLLLKGSALVTQEAAQVFADAGIDLIGTESQSVGPLDAPMAVHLILLKAEVVLLEGIRLSEVPDDVYQLNCAPLNLENCDGAPCRAILMDMDIR